MNSTGLVYNDLVQRLLDALKQPGEDIYDGVTAVICDPPYNTRQIVELSSSEHNRHVLHIMSHFVELPSVVMDVR